MDLKLLPKWTAKFLSQSRGAREEEMLHKQSTRWLLKFLFATVLAGGVSFAAAAQSAPAFSTQTPIYGGSGSSFAVYLPILNDGGATASSVEITSVTFGTATLRTPSLPFAVGDLQANSSFGLPLTFNATPLTVGKNYLLTVRGTYQTPSGTFGFSINRILFYGQLSFFSAPANPLNVNPTLDATHAVTQIISAAKGGSITATGADGSSFTLTIPANALLSDESITLTPLLAIKGLPISGGFVAGTQFAPEGLRFRQPATLTIQPAKAVPISQQIAFGYHANGSQFHFQPFGLTQAITIPVLHFSGVGIGRGTPGNPGTPTSLEDRLDNAVAPIVAAERASLFPTDPPTNVQALVSAQANMLVATGTALVPEATEAAADDSQAESAVAIINDWLNQVSIWNPQILTVDPGAATQLIGLGNILVELRSQIVVNAYNSAFNRCIGDSSSASRFNEAFEMMWAYNESQNMSVYGIGGVVAVPVGFPNYPTQLAACETGQLTFSMTSSVNGTDTVTGAQTFYAGSRVEASQISLNFDPTNLFYTGNGPLNYESRSFSINWGVPGVSDCSSGIGNSGTIAITVQFDLNIDPGLVPSPVSFRMQVTLAPSVTETDTVCLIAGNVTESDTVAQSSYDSYLAISNGATSYGGTSSAPSPYFVNVNTPQTFNLSGSISVEGNLFSATQTTTITLDQSEP